MDETKKDITEQSIIDQLKEYIDTYIKLAKYKAVEKGTTMAASAILGVVLAILAIVIFLFANITLALFLADVLASYWQGFGVVAGLYLLIMIIVLISKSGIHRSITNSFIKKILK